MSHNTQNINEKGTALWGFNQLRAKVLTGILNELSERESTGFLNGECEVIKAALDKMINACTEIPNSAIFGVSLHTRVSNFLDVFNQWCNVAGNDAEAKMKRRKLLNKIRKRRQKIANTVRKLYNVLSQNLDAQLIKAVYDSLKEAIELFPKTLQSLIKPTDYIGKHLKS